MKANILKVCGLLVLIAALVIAGCASKTENGVGNDVNELPFEEEMFVFIDMDPGNIEGLELPLSSIYMAWFVHENIASLVDTSSTIVTGEIIKDGIPRVINEMIGEDREENPWYFLYTISYLRVEQVIKGEVNPGDIIRIRQLGGSHGDLIIEVFPEFDYLQTGQYGVFFLYFSTEECMSASMNRYHGFVEITDGKISYNDPFAMFEYGMSEEALIYLLKELTLK